MKSLSDQVKKRLFLRAVFLASSATLFFAFQNCQQAGMQSSSETSTNSGLDTSNSKAGLQAPLISDKTLNSLTFYYADAVPSVSKVESAMAVRPTSLHLNVLTGQIQVAGDENHYCLSPTESAELQEILKGANVCQSKPLSEQVCAMVYQSPYAVLHFVDQDINLGESRSSCERVDLCEEYPQILKGFFAAVISSLPQKICQ